MESLPCRESGTLHKNNSSDVERMDVDTGTFLYLVPRR